jgi:hypothetical protein
MNKYTGFYELFLSFYLDFYSLFNSFGFGMLIYYVLIVLLKHLLKNNYNEIKLVFCIIFFCILINEILFIIISYMYHYVILYKSLDIENVFNIDAITYSNILYIFQSLIQDYKKYIDNMQTIAKILDIIKIIAVIHFCHYFLFKYVSMYNKLFVKLNNVGYKHIICYLLLILFFLVLRLVLLPQVLYNEHITDIILLCLIYSLIFLIHKNIINRNVEQINFLFKMFIVFTSLQCLNLYEIHVLKNKVFYHILIHKADFVDMLYEFQSNIFVFFYHFYVYIVYFIATKKNNKQTINNDDKKSLLITFKSIVITLTISIASLNMILFLFERLVKKFINYF